VVDAGQGRIKGRVREQARSYEERGERACRSEPAREPHGRGFPGGRSRAKRL